MKNNLFRFLATLFSIFSLAIPVSCSTGDSTPKDYNADVQTVAQSDIAMEHFTKEENVTYYTSDALSLWMSVRGAFLEMPYFSLDGNKRVYDNLYFYERDYFYMLSGDLKDFYAALKDSVDSEYAEVEKSQGEDAQVNINKSGIYTLVFDTDTLLFDMQYKAEITQPVYYTIKNCDILVGEDFIPLTVNPENEDEFVLSNIALSAGEAFCFLSHIHTSHYRVTLDETCKDKYASGEGLVLWANFGGNYNLYINAKTYVVRAELLNPDTATYACVYYDGTDFVTLQPYETGVPYIFRRRVTASRLDFVPDDYYSEEYKRYDLTVLPSPEVTSSGDTAFFKDAGTYDLTINLKTFSISVERVPE